MKSIQDKIVADEAENIVVISHAGTMKVWQEIWSGAELREYTQYGKPGSVSFFRLLDTGERVTVLLNDLSYQEE